MFTIMAEGNKFQVTVNKQIKKIESLSPCSLRHCAKNKIHSELLFNSQKEDGNSSVVPSTKNAIVNIIHEHDLYQQSFIRKEMKQCLKKIQVEEFSPEWEKNIKELLPQEDRIKHSVLINKILKQVKVMYRKDMQEFAEKVTLNSETGDNGSVFSKKHTEQRFLEGERTVHYKTFLRHRQLLANKYFLFLEPIRTIVDTSQLKLPNVICDFHRYNNIGLVSLNDFQTMVNSDIKKGSMSISNQFYVEVARTITEMRILSNVASRQLAKIMRCTTNVFVQQVLNIMIKSIDHILNAMSGGSYCPQIKLRLEFQNGQLLVNPNIEQIFSVHRSIIENIERIAQDLTPLEKWLNLKSTSKYIKIKLPEWYVKECHTKLQKILDDLFQPVKHHLQCIIDEFRPVCAANIKRRITSLTSEKTNFDFYLKQIRIHNVYLLKANAMVANTYYTVGKLEQIEAKEALKKQSSDVINAYLFELVKYHQEYNQSICSEFESVKAKALNVPNDAKSLIQLTEYISHASKVLIKELEQKIQESIHMLSALMEVTILTEDHIELNKRAINWLREIEPVFLQNHTLCEAMKSELEDDMQRRINLLNSMVDDIVPQLSVLDDMDDVKRTREYVEYYKNLLKRGNEIDREMRTINEEERLFRFPETEFPKVIELNEIVRPFYALIRTIYQWQRDHAVWLNGPFEWLDATVIQKKTLNYFEEITEMSKSFKSRIKMDVTTNKLFKFTGIADDPDPMQQPAPLKLCWQALNDINEFKEYLPLVICMCNPALRNRHWAEMSAIRNFDITPNAGTSLRKMIEFDLMGNIDKYEAISIGANRELALQRHLAKMIKEWDSISFEMDIDNGSGIIVFVHINDIELLLGEHLVMIEEMETSDFVKPIASEATDFHNSLLKIQEIINQWDCVQILKLSLDSIFSYPRMNVNLPEESALYADVNKILLNIQSSVLECPDFKKMDDSSLLEALYDAREKLEKASKGTKDYMETKRLRFPRLFFLSDREIQNVLFESGNVENLSVSFKKCFAGIQSLRISKRKYISSIIGDCNEKLRLCNYVSFRDDVDPEEKWLIRLEREMSDTMQKSILECYQTLDKGVSYNDIINFPSMAMICAFQIYWTSEVHSCFPSCHSSSLQSLHLKFIDHLASLINEMRNCPVRKHRNALMSLIIVVSHQENIIKLLLDRRVTETTSFEWFAQLRYYLEDNCVKVSMFNTSIKHGYEYSYYTQCTVNTPLTERCFRVLMQAFEYHLYGVVIGPSATGKTETFKSLARAVGMQLRVFNCTDALSYKFLSQIFKGLVTCGAWLCFEDFDALTTQVLSAITQQIARISQAVAANLKTVTFEGSQLSLNPTGHICVIMNLDRTARSDLPDNLKILFRTVAMVVPDENRIAEVELFAGGFSDSKALALKLVTLCKLLSEQLWCKSCSNFGISYIKTVVKTAISLKRSFSEENEATLIVRSVVDTYLPKLCDQDVIIFKNILHDTFPEVTSFTLNYTTFLDTLETICKNKSLCNHDIFKLKIIQLFELLYIRQALMLVSDPFGGKTEILRTLVEILSSSSYNREVETLNNIKLEIIIPGAATDTQLFGQFDNKSGIWKDGVCSKIFRSFSEDQSCDKKWMVFDGPLNDAWVEKLYTALDTSRILFLDSGERITMTDSMSIIFETMSMTEISPALLSRCGIVYIETSSIDWRSHVKPLIFNNSIYAEHKEILFLLFEWTIEPCLRFLQKHCALNFNVGHLHLVTSMMNLFEMYLKDACEENTEETGKISHFVIWAQAALILSITWGFGGILNMDSQIKFNAFYMSILNGTNTDFPRPQAIKHYEINLPNTGTMQDYVYIFKGLGNWKYWGDILKNEKILEIPECIKIFVPTLDSLKYNNVLLKHIKHKKPFLLCGGVSVGKTTFVQELLKTKLTEENYLSHLLSFTSLKTVEKAQLLLLSKLNKIRRRHYGPPVGRFCINFMDDLNAGRVNNKSNIDRILELLRQYLNYGYFYDPNEPEKIYIRDVMISLAVTANATNDICSRFLRHFNIYTLHAPSADAIFRIFSNVLLANLKRNLFAADVSSSVTSITNATIEVYNSLIDTLKPTPAKFQYCFNIRDVSRIIDGCSLLQKESVETKVTFIRLWVHEIWRVFADRMLNNKDKEWLFLKIRATVKVHFKDSFETAFDYLPKFQGNQITQESFDNLMFGNFMELEKSKGNKYEEINSIKILENKVMAYLTEYNNSFKKHIDIVVSRYTLQCLIKISRILATPGGNLLIISTPGSGRKSTTSLAAYMQRQKFIEPSVYSYSDFNVWRGDLKTALRECGGLKKDLTFFVADKQIKDSYLGDIGSLLATGEIPDLFTIEDRRSIVEMVRLHAQQGNRNAEISIRSVMNYFVQQCRNKLHIVLCFSPTNDAIRSHLRANSELVKHCTINWYEMWPKESLERISAKYIQDVNIGENLKLDVIRACVKFYDNAREVSVEYMNETSRTTCIGFRSFLHMLKLYSRLMSEKQKSITATRNKYLAGLEKLELAAQQVEKMKATLTILKPQLELSAQQTIATMKEVENENVIVERATILVKREEEIANKKAEIAGTLKIECEADLAVAIPILEDAVGALNTLKPTDITLVKAMKNPPDTVKLVMAAICVMLNVPPDRTVDPVTGKKHTDYWGPSKRILGDMNFLQILKEYDKDNIPTSVMQVIKKTYMTDNNFRPHIVTKASSAAEGLCKWVRAMVSYDEVAKVVAPKKRKLLGAQKECDEAEAFLNEKQRTLSALNAKLAALNNSLRETLQQKLELEKEVEICTNKLKKAESLIASLGGEKNRWVRCAECLRENYDNLVGDIVLSSGAIAYMAPYSIAFRDKIFVDWKAYIRDLKIPCSEEYNFVSILGEESEINRWYFSGLPKNRFSTENAIIMKNSDLWCLFIDSQNQANKWIKKIEERNDLGVVKLTNPDCMKIIQRNAEHGKPILIENVGEQLEILLDPFLLKTIYENDGIWYLDTGRGIIRYSHDFRLYITTRLLRPQYSYETFSKLTIIDFSIPNEALQDRLLDIVISREKPELQEKFEILLIEDADYKKVLKQQEDNILSTLSSTTTNILEDESAIRVLDTSKNLSLNVIKKQETTKLLAMEINKFRDTYVQYVKHCAGLFSTLTALSFLNHMYRFSFSWFMQLYVTSIETANRSVVLERRLKYLMSSFTHNLHSSVCRSLFEKHRILYSFLLCSKILIDEQRATEDEVKFFTSLNSDHLGAISNSAPNWLPLDVWKNVSTLSCKLPTFYGFQDDFRSNDLPWKKYYDSEPLQSHLMPEPWRNKLSPFQKVILVKTLRPDKIINEILRLIEDTLGDVQNYSAQLKISYSHAESSCLTPLIFILPSCSSPLSLISTYARTKGYSSKLVSLSMAEGQEIKAEFLIREAQREGGWVFLENCHLVTRWLIELESICENCTASNVSLDFRLWLSSYPVQEFPIGILQNSIKITNDYPLNFKQSLLNVYHSEPMTNEEFVEGCPGKDKDFTRLLFGFCLFHIVARERSRCGIQGWNVPYHFDHSDFKISVTELQKLINSVDHVSFDAILCVIGECSYGGKIMDDFDRRCLRYLLEYYCDPNVIKDHRHASPIDIEQLIPQQCEYLNMIQHISNMPLDLSPQIFGSDENGIITRDTFIATDFFSSMSNMHPVVLQTNGNLMQDQVLLLINDINDKLPESVEINELEDKYISASSEPLKRVLHYERLLLKQHLTMISETLDNLKLAFEGCMVLSDPLEKMIEELYHRKVPRVWKRLQTEILTDDLSYFIDNLVKRMSFITNWIHRGYLSVVRFDTLFSCRMFLSAILLTFGKRNNIPFEGITFNFEVVTKELVEEERADTYFIHGLHLSAARWDAERNILARSLTNVFWQDMPPIRLTCSPNGKNTDGNYNCPVYVTARRLFHKSIQRNLNNYIISMPLKTDVHHSYWIKCGTALFCHIPL